MNLQISFTDGSIASFPISNKKQAEDFKSSLDSTVKKAAVVKGDQILNWLKK